MECRAALLQTLEIDWGIMLSGTEGPPPCPHTPQIHCQSTFDKHFAVRAERKIALDFSTATPSYYSRNLAIRSRYKIATIVSDQLASLSTGLGTKRGVLGAKRGCFRSLEAWKNLVFFPSKIMKITGNPSNY